MHVSDCVPHHARVVLRFAFNDGHLSIFPRRALPWLATCTSRIDVSRSMTWRVWAGVFALNAPTLLAPYGGALRRFG
eukprot:3946476-Pleurochrysis_carterae.AAC.1